MKRIIETSNLENKNQSHYSVSIFNFSKEKKEKVYFPIDHRWSDLGLFKIYKETNSLPA